MDYSFLWIINSKDPEGRGVIFVAKWKDGLKNKADIEKSKVDGKKKRTF